MCFPNINILCLCVKVLPIIRQCEQRTAIFLLFFAPFFTLGTVGHFPAGMGACQAAVGELAVVLPVLAGKPCQRSSAPNAAEMQAERRWPRRGLQGIPTQTAGPQVEGKISSFPGFVLDCFYF